MYLQPATIDLVMGKPLTVVSKGRQRVVNLADQQILAIVQPSYSVFHILTLAFDAKLEWVSLLPSA